MLHRRTGLYNLQFKPISFFLVGNGQLMATFCPTTGYYLPTIGGGHPLAKTVFVFALTI